MKFIKLFEDYIPFEDIKEEPTDKLITNNPEEVKQEEPLGYGYPEGLEHYGKIGKAFYNFMLSDDDGPVDEFVTIARAFTWALSKKTPDGTICYTIKDPVKKQEAQMLANVFEMALKELKEQGGKIQSSEPIGDWE